MSIFHDKMNLLPPRPTSTRSYSVWDKRQSRSSLSTAPLPSAICDLFMHAEEMNTGKWRVWKRIPFYWRKGALPPELRYMYDEAVPCPSRAVLCVFITGVESLIVFLRDSGKGWLRNGTWELVTLLAGKGAVSELPCPPNLLSLIRYLIVHMYYTSYREVYHLYYSLTTICSNPPEQW